MHKICACVTKIHPTVSLNLFVANAAVSVKLTIHIRNRKDEIDRVMVIERG